ncbi:MAG: AsmA family protein, partial [Chromatocurvus sp.]
TVGHDGITPGEARITANAEDLSTLGHLLNQDLSTWAPFELNGTLQAPRPGHWQLAARGGFGEHRFDVSSVATVSGPRWELDDLAVAIDDGKITGNAVLDRADRLLHASLTSPRLDIDRLMSLAPQHADSGDDQTVALDTFRPWTVDVDVQIEELLWQGYTAAGVTLDAASNADTLKISANIGNASATSDGAPRWRLVEPLQVDATLAFAANDDSAGKLTARFSSSGLVGAIDTTLPAGARRSMHADLQTTVENFSAVQGIDTKRWDTFLPISVSAQVRGTPQQMQLDPLDISFNDDTLKGRLKVDRTRTPLHISGDLQGSALDVNRFRTTPAPHNVKEATGQDNRNAGDVIGDQPIDWSWLEAVLLDLDVHLDTLTFNEAVFRNVRAQVALADGELNVDPLDADLTNGGVRGHVRVRKANAGAAVDIRLIVTELVPADLSPQGKGLIDGGETDLFVDLRATGATPHELATALNGEMVLEIQRATVRNDLLDIIGSDLLTQTVSLINPFTRQDDRTELECAAIRFVAENGVLNSPDQIVIETSKMKIRGGGEINLDDETLRIGLVPSARQGVGIGAGDLARFVRLGGTLGNPQPEADAGAMLKSGATIGAAIATGGVSLLAQGLFNRVRNVGTACGEIFEKHTQVPDAIKPPDPDANPGD